MCVAFTYKAYAVQIPGWLDEQGQFCHTDYGPAHPKGELECHPATSEDRTSLFQAIRRKQLLDRCNFATKWPWQDSSTYWTKERDSFYEVYQEQAAKASTLQSQMAGTDAQIANSLSPILAEVQSKMNDASVCMRYAELIAASGSEDNAFSALGL